MQTGRIYIFNILRRALSYAYRGMRCLSRYDNRDHFGKCSDSFMSFWSDEAT
jgi:hypothetical protein